MLALSVGSVPEIYSAINSKKSQALERIAAVLYDFRFDPAQDTISCKNTTPASHLFKTTFKNRL
jgi:hypothetical protein